MTDIVVETRGPVVILTINRPHARNALIRQTALDVYRALRAIESDPAIRLLVLRGAGKDFCCGADLRASEAERTALDDPAAHWDSFGATALLHEMRAVTVAAIRGGCAGAGLAWTCACDLRVAADDARFNTAFLDVGIAGDMGLPWLLPRIVGAGRARELSFLPRKIDAEEALRIGLIDRLWASDDFETSLAALIERLISMAPAAIAGMKANFVEAERMDLRSFIQLEAERHRRIMQTDGRREAFSRFQS